MKRIPFRPALALAIRQLRKTETRRLITPQPPKDSVGDYFIGHRHADFYETGGALIATIVPSYHTGETIGVAEPWRTAPPWDHLSGKELAEDPRFKKEFIHYEADPLKEPEDRCVGRFRQARFLPDAFVRTTLKIVEVKAELVQEITEEDAVAEGVREIDTRLPGSPHYLDYEIGAWMPCDANPYQGLVSTARESFETLWDSIHAAEAQWAANPFVWVYRFEVIDRKAV